MSKQIDPEMGWSNFLSQRLLRGLQTLIPKVLLLPMHQYFYLSQVTSTVEGFSKDGAFGKMFMDSSPCNMCSRRSADVYGRGKETEIQR